METPPKVDEIEKRDLSSPSARKALERQADKFLRANGDSVLSPKDEYRKAVRRSNIVARHVADSRMQETHGISESISSSKKRALTEDMHVESIGELPHTPSTENIVVDSIKPEEFDQALIFLFDNVFNEDKIARIILIDVLKNQSGNLRKTEEVSSSTGLSIKQINSAKARIRYKLGGLTVTTADELVEFVKGEAK